MGARAGGADEVRLVLNELGSFIKSASARDLAERVSAFDELIQRTLTEHERVLPRKKSARAIARDFRKLSTHSDVWRFGIPYGWLVERFDVSFLSHPDDLPLHTRIGIGIHEGFVQVEESMLLNDATFLPLRARESTDRMTDGARKARGRKDIDAYETLSALNAAVCTYSRLGVLTCAAFIEAFVNSVGLNEAALRTYSTDEDEQLRGKKKGRYLMLETKLERFPRIIRPDKKSPIVISDDAQLRDPFRRFLEETKELRDSSMHYAPGKTTILRPPNEWLRYLETAIEDSVAVAREFWLACYPGRGLPRYLGELDLTVLVDRAKDKWMAELRVLGS